MDSVTAFQGEVRNVIFELNPFGSADPDGIRTRILKGAHAALAVYTSLSEIFQIAHFPQFAEINFLKQRIDTIRLDANPLV